LLLGIIVAAAGIHAAIAHPSDPAGLASAFALAGGVALFLVGVAEFRRLAGRRLRSVWAVCSARAKSAGTGLRRGIVMATRTSALAEWPCCAGRSEGMPIGGAGASESDQIASRVVECDLDPQGGRLVDGQLAVTAAKVLHEGSPAITTLALRSVFRPRIGSTSRFTTGHTNSRRPLRPIETPHIGHPWPWVSTAA
jgi:hypothetical protein